MSRPLEPRANSERTCIVTGAVGAPEAFLRFALDPEGRVTPDLGAKLPGRGAWVAAARDAVEKAAAKGHFARAFKSPARLPDGATPQSLADAIEQGLSERALSALGLARRAGAAVAGFDQVRAWLTEGRVGVLLTARDAAENGAAKLSGLAGTAPIVRAFDVAALSAALGKPRVTHAAIAAGREAERFLREARRLDGFCAAFAERASTAPS